MVRKLLKEGFNIDLNNMGHHAVIVWEGIYVHSLFKVLAYKTVYYNKYQIYNVVKEKLLLLVPLMAALDSNVVE